MGKVLFIHFMKNSKRAFSVLSVIGFTIGFSGCGFERPFHIEATYRAPKTGYEITIFATGVVPAGADIVDVPSGTVEIRPLATQQSKKMIVLTILDERHISFQYDERNSLAVEWDFRTRVKVFADVLTQAGYDKPDADEVEETLGVLYGVMYGPKATRLKGQTKFLQVIEVKRSAA